MQTHTHHVHHHSPQSGEIYHQSCYVDPAAPVHIRVGTGGIQLGVAWQPKPEWSAVRLQQFGFLMWRVFAHNNTMSFEVCLAGQ
jgi:Iron/zinc purple acid phosphatase-like protein C